MENFVIGCIIVLCGILVYAIRRILIIVKGEKDA